MTGKTKVILAAGVPLLLIGLTAAVIQWRENRAEQQAYESRRAQHARETLIKFSAFHKYSS